MADKSELFFEVVNRDHRTCQGCGFEDTTEECNDLWVKRVNPEGSLDPKNLITLCKFCVDVKALRNPKTFTELKKFCTTALLSRTLAAHKYTCKRCGYTDRTGQHLYVERRDRKGNFNPENLVVLDFYCREIKRECDLQADWELQNNYKWMVQNHMEAEIVPAGCKPILPTRKFSNMTSTNGGK